jgi:VCBS repeat-containing protein
VNSADQIVPRYNATTPTTMLRLLVAPAVVATDDVAATDEDTAVPIAVLSNDRNVGGSLSVNTVSATSSLGAAITINADQTIRYDPTVSATLQALNAGQSLWDTFTYTIRDSKGLLDTATVKVLVSGLNEVSHGVVLNAATSASSPATVVAAHDAALSAGNLDSAAGYLRWLDEFDLLASSNRKSDNSILGAVDAVIGGTVA